MRRFGRAPRSVKRTGRVVVVVALAAALLAPAAVLLGASPAGATVVPLEQFGPEGYLNAAWDLAVDGSGAIYLAGDDFGTSLDAFAAKYDTGTGDFAWYHQINSTGATPYEGAYGVAVDGSGNVYVTGYTSGVLGSSSAGGDDVFVRKYDSSGNVLWTAQLGGAGDDYGQSVAVDGSGNVYVSGSTGGSDTTDGAAVLYKLDSSGAILWSKPLGPVDSDARRVRVDGSGNVYVAGRKVTQAYLARYTSTNALVWETVLSSSSAARGLALDASGNPFVAGEINGDAFVASYSAAGAQQWLRQLGTADSDVAEGVAVDSAGVYVAGSTDGPLAGPDPGLDRPDVFLRKYDAAGVAQWTQQFGTGEYDYDEGFSVAPTGAGGAYVVGRTTGALVGTHDHDNTDSFLVRVDPDAAVPPTVTQQPVSASVRVNDDPTFSAKAVSSTDPTDVQWELTTQWQAKAPGDPDFTDLTGATGWSLSLTNVSLGMSGTLYRAAITNVAGTVYTTPATLTVADNVITIEWARVSKGWVTVKFATTGTPPLEGFQCDLGSRREPWVDCTSEVAMKAHGKTVTVRGHASGDPEGWVESAPQPIVHAR